MSSMRFNWPCAKCSKINPDFLDECQQCGEPGGMPGPTRTQQAGRVLQAKAEQGYTFARVVLKSNAVSEDDKMELDAILAKDIPRKKKAIEIVRNPRAAQAASFFLVSGFYSAATIGSYCSEVKLYEEIVQAGGLRPWPVSEDSIQVFASAMKAVGYKSTRMYFSAITQANEMMNFRLSLEEKQAMRLAKNACRRDGEDERFKEPIELSMLDRVNDTIQPNREALLTARLCVIGLFFMLRPDELLKLRGYNNCGTVDCKCHADVCVADSSMRIAIRGDKTDQSGKPKYRSLQCVCQGNKLNKLVPMCPVCCTKLIRRDSDTMGADSKWWVSQGIMSKRMGQEGFRKMMREMLVLVGEKVVDERGIHRFGGQSLRRGGAQAAALAGVPVHLIKLFGRWTSDVVYRYVRDTPLDTVNMAKLMYRGACDGVEFRTPSMLVGETVLVPDVQNQVWLQGDVCEVSNADVTVSIKSVCAQNETLVVKVQKNKVVRM